jgi:SNF2 family DNA or RNA helicase
MHRIKNLLSQGLDISSVAYKTYTSESTVEYIYENPSVTKPFKNLDDIKRRTAKCSFIIKKEDCLDLPEKIYQTIKLEFNADQKKIYKELKRQLYAEYRGEVLTTTNAASLTIRLQQITGGFFPSNDETKELVPIGLENPKIERLILEIEESGESKIIVWARFVAEIKLIQNSLRKAFPYKRVETYYGSTADDDRNRYKNEFQAGLIDVLVINPACGSDGLNLQRSSNHYYYSNGYSFSQRAQSEDRSHRIGQTRNVLYKDLVIVGSIDERIISSLKDKKDVLEYFRGKNIEEVL